MICESLLSSFSDSYFQGLLPAQNQFCRRVRKDAGFLTCPPFASALSANPAHQSGKHQRTAACCIQFGTGPAGRGKFVVGRIGLTGDHKAVGFYRLFDIIADGRVQNLDVIDYSVNSRFANVLQLDGVADRIGPAAMGEPAEPKVILRSSLTFSQVILSVVLPFSMLSWSESSTYSAVTPVGRVMLSASVSGPACSFWTTSVTL